MCCRYIVTSRKYRPSLVPCLSSLTSSGARGSQPRPGRARPRAGASPTSVRPAAAPRPGRVGNARGVRQLPRDAVAAVDRGRLRCRRGRMRTAEVAVRAERLRLDVLGEEAADDPGVARAEREAPAGAGIAVAIAT